MKLPFKKLPFSTGCGFLFSGLLILFWDLFFWQYGVDYHDVAFFKRMADSLIAHGRAPLLYMVSALRVLVCSLDTGCAHVCFDLERSAFEAEKQSLTKKESDHRFLSARTINQRTEPTTQARPKI
jgi:hypothetical protein